MNKSDKKAKFVENTNAGEEMEGEKEVKPPKNLIVSQKPRSSKKTAVDKNQESGKKKKESGKKKKESEKEESEKEESAKEESAKEESVQVKDNKHVEEDEMESKFCNFFFE